jgi:hypothetical protein
VSSGLLERTGSFSVMCIFSVWGSPQKYASQTQGIF